MIRLARCPECGHYTSAVGLRQGFCIVCEPEKWRKAAMGIGKKRLLGGEKYG